MIEKQNISGENSSKNPQSLFSQLFDRRELQMSYAELLKQAKENKHVIRKEMQEKRNKLSQGFISKNSAIIKEKLINMEEYKKAEMIYIYMSFNNEVETKDIISHALAGNKKVAIPKITDNNMQFYYINNINDTVVGKWRNKGAY